MSKLGITSFIRNTYSLKNMTGVTFKRSHLRALSLAHFYQKYSQHAPEIEMNKMPWSETEVIALEILGTISKEN